MYSVKCKRAYWAKYYFKILLTLWITMQTAMTYNGICCKKSHQVILKHIHKTTQVRPRCLPLKAVRDYNLSPCFQPVWTLVCVYRHRFLWYIEACVTLKYSKQIQVNHGNILSAFVLQISPSVFLMTMHLSLFFFGFRADWSKIGCWKTLTQIQSQTAQTLQYIRLTLTVLKMQF